MTESSSPTPSPSPRAGVQAGAAREGRQRVLVCGSGYGRAYLDAMAASGGRFEPVALLARGGARSAALARRHRLPLVRSPQELAELPGGIDLVCSALPSSADEVVLALLERGLPVLCEHPRRAAFLDAAYAAAARAGTVFELNGHFGDLEPARAFAARCREAAAQGPPRFVELTAQERGLFGALDVLDRALPRGVGETSIERVGAAGDLQLLAGSLAGVPALVRVETPAGAPVDGSPRYRVDLKLEIVFDEGIAALLSLAGPATWNANLALAAAAREPLWTALGRRPLRTPDELRTARERANLAALERLARAAAGQPDPTTGRDRTLALARAWEALGDRLR